ncbi:hypothetical protein KTAU_27880 [Thermogemmatispora aurantia]|uniref:DUF2079 domain-containing protein n=1 Tax=Thermogemmatispora aurantia TaxID=2045279 RepID=UPI00124C005E|nr:DUF2079 domain-containing protein [Thermogemmatispora aurantia]GER84152.1 hypothetical protein KTAU_27880 [Thermogemmatispora aurantia]
MNKIGKWLHLTLRRWRVACGKELYPPPEPLPRGRAFWLALGLVVLAMLAYSVYFVIFVTSKQDAFATNGEDLGIMDQAIWNTLHGALLHQTICNVLTDTNCYGLEGINRFAIHYEPILFLIVPLYIFWADPKTLLILQVLVVATGALPAFWLARLRLRSDLAAVPFALLYLLYPAQQYAVDYDFHAVTLTLALLLFTLYFMYTQRNGWFLAFAILSLACKEEIAGVIALLGLWMVIFQRRWRIGLIVFGLAVGWTAIGLLIVHYASPIGHSLLASRWSEYGDSPVEVALNILLHPLQVIRQHVLEPQHRLYLQKLLAPAGYLPLLAPWVLVLASPTLALNLLSSSPNMYSGRYQYNAEIVPILIFATIEAVVLLLWLLRRCLQLGQARLAQMRGPALSALPVAAGDQGKERPAWSLLSSSAGRWFGTQPAPLAGGRLWPILRALFLLLLLSYVMGQVVRATARYDVYSAMPYAAGFIWPSQDAHDRLAYHFLQEIPPTASVSTQTMLVPHLSERRSIYLFPYGAGYADYILLNAPGYYYPFQSYADYEHTVDAVLSSGEYGVIDMQDGYILLKKGAASTANQQAVRMVAQYRHTD